MAPRRPKGAGAFPKPVESPVPSTPDPAELYAALDLGTNSCRMLIAQPKGSQFHVVDSFSKSVQLGAGLERSGQLSRSSMGRTIQALRVCQQKLKRHQVRHMRLVATEACRRARNAKSFITQVERETGLTLEIIQPEEEARLAVISCAPLVSTKTDQLLVVDIGGGSTELVWIDLTAVPRRERPRAIMRLHSGFHPAESPFPAAKVVDWISVPLGVATLRDQFRDVRDDTARFALMSWFFEENLAEFAPYRDEQAREGFQIIGTSGTVTTVAASHLGLKRYDRTKVDGLRMTSDQIDRVIRDYLALGPEGRRRDPRIGQDRQTLIMSGSAILQALLRCWPTDRLSVADRGLREGLLYDRLPPHTRAQDPLLAGVSAFASQRGAPPTLATRMAAWTLDAAPARTHGDERLRLAATMLALASMQIEPNVRLPQAIEWALQKRWIGIDGKGRAMVAAAIAANGNSLDLPDRVRALASAEALEEAICWGLALRLARRLGARSRRSLQVSRLAVREGVLVLRLADSHAALFGQSTEKDMKLLSGRLGLGWRCEIVSDEALSQED